MLECCFMIQRVSKGFSKLGIRQSESLLYVYDTSQRTVGLVSSDVAVDTLD